MERGVKPFRSGPVCTGGTGTNNDRPVIRISYYDEVTARSNPEGLLVRFDADSPVGSPITRLEFGMEGNGEQNQIVTFPTLVGSDGRFFRAFAFKPTINGTFPLVMIAHDAQGRIGVTRCTPGVTVTF